MHRSALQPAHFRAISLWSGLFYLVIIVTGISAECVIRAPRIDTGDAAATARNVLDNVALFRLGFAADSIMAMADIAVAVLLFFLFRAAQPVLATLAMVFRLIQAAILSMNMLLHHAALSLLLTDAPETASTALTVLNLQAHGYDLGLIFFGVNSLLMAALLVRADFAPRILAVLVAAAGLVYLGGSYVRFLAPSFHPAIEPAYLIPLIAELAFALWLVAKGLPGRAAAASARLQAPRNAAASSARSGGGGTE